jgi:uncharacterized protein
MIARLAEARLAKALAEQASVAILGPRQVGKTTLALRLAETRPSVYLDLEDPADRARLTDPKLYLQTVADRLVILDEVHRLPDLFEVLRGVIDQGRRTGRGVGRFLMLASASAELLSQSSESLAGRITYLELPPLCISELADRGPAPDQVWLRGGFPGSVLAADDAASLRWRLDFVRTYLERDVAMFAPRTPAETLRRLWTMLAHLQGSMLNVSDIARNLGISSQSTNRYIDLLVDLMLLRRLEPLQNNVGKRLVKAPKIYIRDSGLTHALLGIGRLDDLLSHPVLGSSWEGWVIENLLSVATASAGQVTPSFYRTAAGAELDLVLDLPNRQRWAVEIKRSLSPSVGRGGHEAVADLRPNRTFVVYPGSERYPLAEGIEAISISDLSRELLTALNAP